MNNAELIHLAAEAMKNSYAPYTGYNVGAALLCSDGKVFTGCNIENSSLTPTCCAERTAFFKAISEGVTSFSAIAVVGGKSGKVTGAFPPCGVCRQVMSEFCDGDFKILLINSSGEISEYSLSGLLPESFRL